MGMLYPLWLGLGMLLPAVDGSEPLPRDPATLREMLFDGQHPRLQSQAALLLVQNRSPDGDDVIRRGLRQTDAPEVFHALASALRLSRDSRFVPDLLAALSSGNATIRQSAARALAGLADGAIILRLQALVEDTKADAAVRQTATWTLGRCGHRSALVALLDQLSNPDESLRQAAADALAELTGQQFGLDLTRWRAWWACRKDMSNDQWLAERLSYQSSRARRLEGELERSRAQIVRLHQQLYNRLPAGDRLGHVQSLADSEDPTVRALAVGWSVELLPGADAVGQLTLTDLLLQWSHDGNADVQRAAVLALGSAQDQRAFDRLVLLLQGIQPTVRAAAARALAQQVKGSGPEALVRQRKVVPALQRALDDPALEVVVEAAESLGALGIPEAGPVLTVLLRHPSRSVRQIAAQALERVADLSSLDGMLDALEDPAVNVRFSLVGAIGHAVGDGRSLGEPERTRLWSRLDGLFLRDADPGVRSRAATVFGQCGPPSALPTLWRRVLASEDSRVQDKAWAAMMEIIIRSANADLLREWDRVLAESKQGPRRLQLLGETSTRWQKREESRPVAGSAYEALVQAQLEEGKWATAFPSVREMLARPGNDADLDRRLRWLLTVGQQALKEGNRAEALHVVQEAQPFLTRKLALAADFEKLEKQAR